VEVIIIHFSFFSERGGGKKKMSLFTEGEDCSSQLSVHTFSTCSHLP
jgi:hypothetical protein